MKFSFPFKKAILLMFSVGLLFSCRLGEALSEADPETNAEVEPAPKEIEDLPSNREELP